jgi:hypothetical protein
MKLLMMPSLVWHWSCRSNQPEHLGTLALPASSGVPSILLESYHVLCCGHDQFSSMARAITPVIVVSTKTNAPYTVCYDRTQNTFNFGESCFGQTEVFGLSGPSSAVVLIYLSR